jgi:hypothetical protein
MTVLVAIPYFGVPANMIDKAVVHALAQTHPNTIVLVAGDGQRPPVTVRDDRLVIGTFPTNRGTPFTQQAMIAGSPFEWYAPHGADDFTARDHIATLLATRAQAAGSSCIWWHEPQRPARILRSRRTWIEFGLFSTTLLRAIGGYGAQEPCGQDSVVTSILAQHPGVRLTTKPTYHKVFRADSLTHDPRTRQGSDIRVGVKARNRDVLLRCEAIGWRNHGAIRAYRESLVPPELRTELDDRAAMVAQWLA